MIKKNKLKVIATSAVTTALLVLTLPSLHAGVTSLTAAQQQDVRAIIKDALMNDPKLLKEAFIALQQREQQGADTAMQTSLADHHQALYDTKSDPWIGSSTPEITLVYFTDFNCPYCKKIEPSLNKLIKEFPQLKIIIKTVPLQGESSKIAVDLAQTVWLNEPEKYSKLKDMLMSSPRGLDAASLAKVAQLTGTERWVGNTDKRVSKMVDDNISLMFDLGLRGTPGLIFADKVIPGLVPYETLKEQLEEVIESQEKNR